MLDPRSIVSTFEGFVICVDATTSIEDAELYGNQVNPTGYHRWHIRGHDPIGPCTCNDPTNRKHVTLICTEDDLIEAVRPKAG